MPEKKKVALMGTMDTEWRKEAIKALRYQCLIFDNTDERWLRAETAEDMAPLVTQDYASMYAVEIIFLRFDDGAKANTARVEFGYAMCLADHQYTKVVLNIGQDVAGREYFRAAAMNNKNVFWEDSFELAVQRVKELLKE